MIDESNKEKLFHILWNVSRQELCTPAHKKDAKCIVMVTEHDCREVAAALLQNDDFINLLQKPIKRI